MEIRDRQQNIEISDCSLEHHELQVLTVTCYTLNLSILYQSIGSFFNSLVHNLSENTEKKAVTASKSLQMSSFVRPIVQNPQRYSVYYYRSQMKAANPHDY